MNQFKKTCDNVVCSQKQSAPSYESFSTVELLIAIQMLVNLTSYYLSSAVILLKKIVFICTAEIINILALQ